MLNYRGGYCTVLAHPFPSSLSLSLSFLPILFSSPAFPPPLSSPFRPKSLLPLLPILSPTPPFGLPLSSSLLLSSPIPPLLCYPSISRLPLPFSSLLFSPSFLFCLSFPLIFSLPPSSPLPSQFLPCTSFPPLDSSSLSTPATHADRIPHFIPFSSPILFTPSPSSPLLSPLSPTVSEHRRTSETEAAGRKGKRDGAHLAREALAVL